MSESFESLDVEVSPSNKLKEISRCVNYCVLFLKQQRVELKQGCNTQYYKMIKKKFNQLEYPANLSCLRQKKSCDFSRHILG